MNKVVIVIIISLFLLSGGFLLFKQEASPVCGANGNTYENRREASKNNIEVAYLGVCVERPEGMVDNRCTVMPKKGECNNLTTKYYFDLEDRVCRAYIWGGCGLVGFDSLKECVDGCGSFGK